MGLIQMQAKHMITPAEYQKIVTDPRCSEGHKFVLDLKISAGEIEIRELAEFEDREN